MVVFSCADNNNIRDKDVFRYNEHKNISGLDPAFAKDNADIWAVHQLFNGLVQMDDNMNISLVSLQDGTSLTMEYAIHLNSEKMYCFIDTNNLALEKQEL